jgi:SulP family sulfate permease
MDVNALHALNNVLKACKKRHITVMLSHVQEQPLHMMQKAGFDQQIGVDNICDNIDKALERAAVLLKTVVQH